MTKVLSFNIIYIIYDIKSLSHKKCIYIIMVYKKNVYIFFKKSIVYLVFLSLNMIIRHWIAPVNRFDITTYFVNRIIFILTFFLVFRYLFCSNQNK